MSDFTNNNLKFHAWITEYGIRRLYSENRDYFSQIGMSDEKGFKRLKRKVKNLINDKEYCGVLFQDSRLIYIVLNGLGRKFEDLFTSDSSSQTGKLGSINTILNKANIIENKIDSFQSSINNIEFEILKKSKVRNPKLKNILLNRLFLDEITEWNRAGNPDTSEFLSMVFNYYWNNIPKERIIFDFFNATKKENKIRSEIKCDSIILSIAVLMHIELSFANKIIKDFKADGKVISINNEIKRKISEIIKLGTTAMKDKNNNRFNTVEHESMKEFNNLLEEFLPIMYELFISIEPEIKSLNGKNCFEIIRALYIGEFKIGFKLAIDNNTIEKMNLFSSENKNLMDRTKRSLIQ